MRTGRKLVPKLASRILGYAARHDYADILDIAAPLVVVKERLSETLPKLPGDMVMRWVSCLPHLCYCDCHGGRLYVGEVF